MSALVGNSCVFAGFCVEKSALVGNLSKRKRSLLIKSMLEFQERLPISATSSSLAMRLAISSEAVAAGDGALSTWTWRAFRS